jgi:predicted transcriptional regulator
MKLCQIKEILLCDVFSGKEKLDTPIEYGCASDLMSDVLAFSRSGAVLLTGLVNIQTVHTAFIAEIQAIVFVRGKKPDRAVVALAHEKNIPLMGTAYSMYEACGILYKKGLISTMEFGESIVSPAGR